jgi:acetylornithine deacetylase/succinyl-diaminopimelate desuccinylase-like protein
MPPAVKLESVRRYANEIRGDYEELLTQLVAIPTVSMDPSHAADIRKGARAAVELLRSFGARAEIFESRGNPVVFGRFSSGRAAPTVTVYNHLDVQPADGPEWRRPPFRMQIEKGRYFGRGTTDDKGPALAAAFAARFVAEAELPINVQFLWELEEEIGSPNFESVLVKNARRMGCDSVVVSDTIWINRQQPAICAGLRGLLGATLRLDTGRHDAHSGLTGGAARNPLAELSALITELVDAKSGRCKIPGFYADVVPPSRRELASFARSGFSLSAYKRAHGLFSLRQRDAPAVMRAIWAEPTLEVHGIAGGYQGPGIKTVVPPFAEAKISMRLVPDQKPAGVFNKLSAYVKKLNPDVVVSRESTLMPYRGVTEGPLADAAAEAIRFGFGKAPATVREGGSIGAVLTMQQVLECPVMFLGLSLPEHGYHAPNENFDWRQASGGIAMFVHYFELLSQPASPSRVNRAARRSRARSGAGPR